MMGLTECNWAKRIDPNSLRFTRKRQGTDLGAAALKLASQFSHLFQVIHNRNG